MNRILIQSAVLNAKDNYEALYKELRSALDGSKDRLTIAEVEALQKDLDEGMDLAGRIDAVVSQFRVLATNGEREKLLKVGKEIKL